MTSCGLKTQMVMSFSFASSGDDSVREATA